MKKIAAVVVTYNRFDLVQRTISALKNQTRRLDAIIVIDNACTDGTSEWLDEQKGLLVIHQDNVGGAGGFWRGIKEAYERGYDWIWCMDDDVFPREDCLEQMLKHSDDTIGILCPHRIMGGKSYIAELKRINLSNPFKDIADRPLTSEEVMNNDVVDIQGMSFEGPLIKRDVVKRIGLPNKDLFILFDDTDYSYRTFLAGYRVVLVRDTIIDKHHFTTILTENQLKVRNKWKLPYHIRNNSYFCHKYGKNIWAKYFGALPFVIKMYFAVLFNFIKGHKYKMSDIFLFTKMFHKGKKHKLGKL